MVGGRKGGKEEEGERGRERECVSESICKGLASMEYKRAVKILQTKRRANYRED